MNKIIQISNSVNDTGDEALYCLTEDGKVYYWGSIINPDYDRTKTEASNGDTPVRLYGWIEQVSKINQK